MFLLFTVIANNQNLLKLKSVEKLSITIAIIGENEGLGTLLLQHNALRDKIELKLYKESEAYRSGQNFYDVTILLSDDKNEIKQAEYADIVITDEKNMFEEEGRVSICRPYRLRELFFYIEKSLEFAKKGKKLLNIGAIKFNYPDKLVLSGDKVIELTDKEAELINVLIKKSPDVVSKNDILSAVWGYNAGIDTHTLETHIYRLRKKLDANIIITDKDGYRLNNNA